MESHGSNNQSDKKQLQETLKLFKLSETSSLSLSTTLPKLIYSWPRGLLLYGPPGTGKILFLPTQYACLVHILFIEHMLEKVRVLREAFSEASSHAMSGKPSVVFIDEIDALCPRRDFRYGDDVKENFDNICTNEEKHYYKGTLNGTIHVVAGGGGASLSPSTTLQTKWSFFRDYDYGFLKLTAFDHSNLLFEYKKSRDGKVYDSFRISRDCRDILACTVDSCPSMTLAS
uniref:ATPase AAA-type core domain-containing protein n=1 Tax=Fagus sylvatica TaxID=28930 RepID=A0A2N9EW98_FAGSY